uniref:Uncharacterized protein n=1 Tax=Anguilla anguilla TaxID=7936 RepID=A0A0E9PLU6_ANGAN
MSLISPIQLFICSETRELDNGRTGYAAGLVCAQISANSQGLLMA